MTDRLLSARLREGTEVLRTGGSVALTAPECALLLDFLDELKVAYEGYYESGDLAHLLNMEAKLRGF